MSITAAQVKELRERTGVGMMECKKALEETKGNMEEAIEVLRKSGRTKADKKAGRVAAEGIVLARTNSDNKSAILLEINSETDFVARDQNFLAFADAVAQTALNAEGKSIQDVTELSAMTLETGMPIEEARQVLVAKVGENINVRRLVIIRTESNVIGTYVHGNRIGVAVEMEGGDADLAKDVAMHIAASKPLVITADEVPSDVVEKEKEIYMAQAASSGKPQDIIEKMVGGRIKKFLDEVSLMGQPFVKDPDMTVAALLNKHRAKVVSFSRFEVGEGIEKEKENFVEAVMAQVNNG